MIVLTLQVPLWSCSTLDCAAFDPFFLIDTSKLKESRAMIYKNGSRYRTSTSDPRDNYGYHYNNYVAAVVDMNGSSDYVELYGLTNKEGGTDCKITKSHEDSTYFGAYRILT